MNRKGSLGDVIFFAVAIGILGASIYFSSSISARGTSYIKYSDMENTMSMLAESIINSPSCLLYTKTVNVNGQEVLETQRNLISWDKASDQSRATCIKKEPYLWEAEVYDNKKSDSVVIGEFAGCSDPKSLEVPVGIARNDKIDTGKVNLKVCDKSPEVTFKIKSKTRDTREYDVDITNEWASTNEYSYLIDVVNSSGKAINEIAVCGPFGCGSGGGSDFRLGAAGGQDINTGKPVNILEMDITVKDVNHLGFTKYSLRINVTPKRTGWQDIGGGEQDAVNTDENDNYCDGPNQIVAGYDSDTWAYQCVNYPDIVIDKTDKQIKDGSGDGDNFFCDDNRVVYGGEGKYMGMGEFDRIWCGKLKGGTTVDLSTKRLTDGICSSDEVVCGAQNDPSHNDMVSKIWCCKYSPNPGETYSKVVLIPLK